MALWHKKIGMMPWLWVSAVIIALDLYTKHLASSMLVYATPVKVLPVFNLTLLHNPGAAFSFLGDADGWQRWLFSGIAIVVSGFLIVWLKQLRNHQTWLAIALALILGGALGNLYDRLTLGYVVDFLHFHWNESYFPAFNIADSAITVGAGMLIIDAVFNKEEAK